MNGNTFSRFRNTPEVIYDDKETLDVWQPPEFLTADLNKNLIGSFLVTSDYEGRPDLISNLLYKSDMYDWVLIAFNNVTDTLNWPPSGLRILYPSSSIVITGVAG